MTTLELNMILEDYGRFVSSVFDGFKASGRLEVQSVSIKRTEFSPVTTDRLECS